MAADAAQGEMFPFHFAPMAGAVVLLGEKKKKVAKNHISCRKKEGHTGVCWVSEAVGCWFLL